MCVVEAAYPSTLSLRTESNIICWSQKNVLLTEHLQYSNLDWSALLKCTSVEVEGEC